MVEGEMQNPSPRTALIFGASGAIGGEIAMCLAKSELKVIGVGRGASNSSSYLARSVKWSLGQRFSKEDFGDLKQLDAVIWAQGANYNDTIIDFDRERHLKIYEANVVYIMESLNQLLDLGLVSAGARLCVISSIWQEIARQNKLSYTVTKSALRGLVQSLAIDLGTKNILVNAVLPGALDTPMTRENLSTQQIQKLESETPLKTLTQFEDVCELVAFLCSPRNTGLTGQFIAADRGYSFVRHI
jgi:NAD(P)-dependent dehydrogenase (short-subunit alcohol dehydrogenase family)